MAPLNDQTWARTKPVLRLQHTADTQEPCSHLVGHLKGGPLTVLEEHSNDGNRDLWAILCKHVTAEQHHLIAGAVKKKLLSLKHAKEKGEF